MTWPLSANAPGENVIRAKTMFSGGPWRSTMVREVPVLKLTEVSDGAGPEVSSTITRLDGNSRGAVGPGGAAVVGIGRRPPQAQRPSAIAPSQVAGLPGPRDIARVVKGER